MQNYSDTKYQSKKESPVILQNKYTRYPKGLEIFMFETRDLSVRDYKILIAVVHLTYGFSTDETTAKPEKIAKMTGIKSNHVSTSLQRLHKLGLILRERSKISMIPKTPEAKEEPNHLEPDASEEEMIKLLWPSSIPAPQPSYSEECDLASDEAAPIRGIIFSLERELHNLDLPIS